MRRAFATLVGILLATSGTVAVESTLVDNQAIAASGPTLVFGEADNGFEGDKIADTLRTFGYEVDRSARLPDDISQYEAIWYIEAYRGLDPSEIASLISFVDGGGSLYLTGERPCCETLNDTVEQVTNEVLGDGRSVSVGGVGDIPGTFTFNAGAAGDISSSPNLLVDFIPDAPGALSGFGRVTEENVFAASETVVVGGVWPEDVLRTGLGRLVLLMDIDWIGRTGMEDLAQNIQAFLTREGGCSDTRHWDGFAWAGPTPTLSPSNCSTISTPKTVTWTAGSDDGAVTFAVTATDATANCSYTAGPAAVSSYTCQIDTTSSTAGRLRVEATDARGTSVRIYRVARKNDARNIPVPFGPDADWWDLPDADADGIPDYWETNGVWVDNEFLNLPALGANPLRKNLYLYIDFEEGNRLSQGALDNIMKAFRDAPLGNPDGSTGVDVWIDVGSSVPSSVVGDVAGLNRTLISRASLYSGFATSARAGSSSVPQIFRYLLNVDHFTGCVDNDPSTKCVIGQGWIKNSFLVSGFSGENQLGFFERLQVQDWPGSAEDFSVAANIVHELGHSLGLLHYGSQNVGPTGTATNADYLSVMSYSYSTVGVPAGLFGLGRRVDYSRQDTPNYDWRLGELLGRLTFVNGQWGEVPDFYTVGGANELRFGTEEIAEEADISEVLDSIDPAAAAEFIQEFDLQLLPGADPDADGLGSLLDNCDDVYNPDQGDADGNRVGDVCEPGGSIIVDAGADALAAEGSTVALTASVVAPAGSEPALTWSYTAGADVDPGAVCTFSAPSSVDTSIVCTDDGTFVVTVTADDAVRPLVSDDLLLAVSNVEPAVTLVAPTAGFQVTLGDPVDLRAVLTDAGSNDALSCSIEWADGSLETMTVSAGECHGTHSFAVAGSYSITVTAADDDGGIKTATTTLTVTAAHTPIDIRGAGLIGGSAGGLSVVAFHARTASNGTTSGAFGLGAPRAGVFTSKNVVDLTRNGKTVAWSGTGTLNGRQGHRYNVVVTDSGATGRAYQRNPDTIRVTIMSPAGKIVFEASGPLLLGDAIIQ